MRITSLLAALALAATVSTTVAAPAFADSAANRRLVRISDLDLSSASGKATLATRVARAAEALCGSYATTAEPSTLDEIGACRAQVTSGIDRQIAARRSATQVASAR